VEISQTTPYHLYCTNVILDKEISFSIKQPLGCIGSGVGQGMYNLGVKLTSSGHIALPIDRGHTLRMGAI